MRDAMFRRLFSLDGLNAVVIGGTGVLCGRMAEVLALAGATVIIAGRDPAKGRQRVADIAAAGGKAHFLPANVLERGSIEQLARAATAQVGEINVLINGAGINRGTPYFAITDAEWDEVFAANLRGMHVACQVFGQRMVKRQRGVIVNLASVSAMVPLSRVFAYSATKAAVVNLTQNLAREFAPAGVRVNALSPGFIPAEQNRKVLDEDRKGKILARTPMGRFGEPADLDGAILLLVAPTAGAFLTGINLVVDGGFSAMSI